MRKKGVAIALAVAAAVILGGCANREPMPCTHPAYQTGPSSKLGTTYKRCKYHSRCTR